MISCITPTIYGTPMLSALGMPHALPVAKPWFGVVIVEAFRVDDNSTGVSAPRWRLE
ncbi:hypothetical protein [Pseudonocardia sp.]|uniref:hypothetical protein n=1 Tax=Pseudonocardia sp. TaxID=60912 RepID=UPI003D0C1095